MNDNEAKSLVGEVLTHIDVDPEQGQILLTTASGRKFMIYHSQDCCESVQIVGTDGEWGSLIGKPLKLVEHEEVSQGDPPPEYPDSWTRTNLTFRVDGATVISRWLGMLNGYYSESVDLVELTKEA